MPLLQGLLARFFPPGGLARNVSLLAGGTALGQLITLLATPILTRLYTVEDFGNLQVYQSIIIFGVVLAAWRYELAILLPEADSTAASLSVLALLLTGLTALVVLGGVVVFSDSWIFDGKAKPLQPYLWLMPIAVLGAGVYLVFSNWALRQKHYSAIAATRVRQSTSQVGAQLLIGVASGGGILGLLIGDALGRMVGGFGLARAAWRQSRDLFRQVQAKTMWQAAIRYRDFPLVSAGSALVNTAGFALPALMMDRFFGAQMLGWFALADRLLGIPSTSIGQAVSQVYMSEAARLAVRDPERLQQLFWQTLKKLAILGLTPAGLVLTLGPALFAFVLGQNWREAGVYASLLAVVHYAGFVAWPLIPTLNVLERQRWQLYWDFGRLGLTVGSLLMAFCLAWPPRGAVAAYGGAVLLAYAAHLFLSHKAIDFLRRRRSSANAGLASAQ